MDCAALKTRTVQNNGFDPVWDQPFAFPLTEPALATMLVQVKDEDHRSLSSEFIGQCSLPGVCHVPIQLHAWHVFVRTLNLVHSWFGFV